MLRARSKWSLQQVNLTQCSKFERRTTRGTRARVVWGGRGGTFIPFFSFPPFLAVFSFLWYDSESYTVSVQCFYPLPPPPSFTPIRGLNGAIQQHISVPRTVKSTDYYDPRLKPRGRGSFPERGKTQLGVGGQVRITNYVI